VARRIRELLELRAREGRKLVLGLATGSTPVRLYRELIRMHQEENISFAHVITFNLDEYFGLLPGHPQSYRRFMDEQLFSKLDIPKNQIHIPAGNVPRPEIFDYCRAYEQKMEDCGGIDLQILGIGRTGHIGFNEPGSARESRTRLVTLDSVTRRDAARDFLGEANVPRFAITMGIGTILSAREIFLLAWGESKAEVLADAVEGESRESLPASFLQGHDGVRFLVDTAAGSSLTRFKHPWLVGPVEWNDSLIRQAVTWLAGKLEKPVLKLVDEDYSENGMADLLTTEGSAYELNIRVFNQIQHTITGWPGGKPEADDSSRPERALPFPKRSLVLSPEPQDDVIGMGGTLHRLIDQGNEVHLVYLTSGNLAVPDEEAAKLADLFASLSAEYEHGAAAGEFIRSVQRQIAGRSDFEDDTQEVRKLKGLIRREEARAACRICGLDATRVRFLDLPFYESGKYRQFHPSAADITALQELLQEIQPHQIFLTGVMADPSSVAGVCHELFLRAWEALEQQPWQKETYLWAFRGTGREWEPHEIEMAVPLSPSELANKVRGIYQHASQRSQVPLSRESTGETWQQAESTNRRTAVTYDSLGLADYEALEAFRRFRPA
jgi:glucosamine-6-phosphate deaminase